MRDVVRKRLFMNFDDDSLTATDLEVRGLNLTNWSGLFIGILKAARDVLCVYMDSDISNRE